MLKNEVGNAYGRLTVVARSENYADGTAQWECECECGNRVVQKGTALRSGVVRSCGCFNIESHTKHSKSFTPEYKSWQAMKDRCCNPNSKDYPRYGGRGISICQRWLDSFENFFEDMGERPSQAHTIDRTDNNGNYEPRNCQWATPTRQSNNRRSNHYVTINGETKSVSEWACELGISHQAMQKRLRAHSDPEKLLAPKDQRFA